MNYAELQAAVIGYLHRTDISVAVVDFISRAEKMLFREIDPNITEVLTTGTTSGSTIPFPADCSQVTRVSVANASGEFSLDYFPSHANYVNAVTSPRHFTLQQDTLVLSEVPSGAYTYKLFYIPKMEALSVSVPTNWLLANHEDIYLYAAALEGARSVRNQPEVEKLELLLFGDPTKPGKPGMIASVRSKVQRAAIPSKGPLQIKPRR